jgi:hypothetical protein
MQREDMMPNYLLQPQADHTADPDDLTNAVFAMDVADPGTVSGLTNGTAYVAREFVLSPASAAFTPVAPAALNFQYIGTALDLDAQLTYTFTDTDVTGPNSLDFSSGGKFLVKVMAHQENNDPTVAAPTQVTIGGVIADTQAPPGGYPNPNSQIAATATAWIATVAPGAAETIVIDAPGGSNWSGVAVTIYQIDGYVARDVVVDFTFDNTKDLTVDILTGSPVITSAIFDDAPAVTGNLTVDGSLGTVDASGNVALGEEWGSWSDDAAAATGPTVFSFSTGNGNGRYAVTVISLEPA